jgi:hypothetical protein
VLEAERWASGWLGAAWLAAPLGDRTPEYTLCLEVVGRASTKPSRSGLAAVSAFRRVVAENEHKMLDETIEILTESQPTPRWSASPAFEAKRAWRAVDVWDSERVLFVEYASDDPAATEHTLMGHVNEVAGTLVAKLGILQAGAAGSWASMRDPDEVPMPLTEISVAEALADLAGCLRQTDMKWPRHDDEDFVDVRALAWARCRAFLPDWPQFEPLADAERDDLAEAFLADVGVADGELADVDVLRSLAQVFLDFGDGYLHDRPLGWSPDAVATFLSDWLQRKVVLDAAQRVALPEALRCWLRFALRRRGVEQEWIEPVVAAVDVWLPDFVEAFDDETSWGPAKQVAAELAVRGIDLTDRDAVDGAIRALNAERLARSLTLRPPEV